MKKSSFCFSGLLLLLFLFITSTFSLAYYDGSEKRGWWWYRAEKKEEVKEEKKEVKKQDKKEKKKEEKKEVKQEEEKEWKPPKPLEAYTYEELLKMPVKDFQKLFNYYRDLAVSDPNERNLYYFYNLVDVARKKALLFMANAMYVMNKYPELNLNKDIPTTNPGLKLTAHLQVQEEEALLKRLSDDFGLIFFVKASCPYCRLQYGVANYFKKRGYNVKIVDLDTEPEAARVFGIEVVPTTILVYQKTGQFIPVAVGAVSVDELRQSIVKSMGYLEGTREPGQIYLYEFEKGSQLDPYTPPPLFKKNRKEGGKK